MPFARAAKVAAIVFLAMALGTNSAAARSRDVPCRAPAEVESLKVTAGAAPKDSAEAAGSSPSVLARLAFGTLRAYRATLSAQDAQDCQFHPSCSHYAEDAIRYRGLLAGSVMAFSRLQRCHPRAYNYYPLDETRVRLHDPVVTKDEPPTEDPMTIPSPRNPAVAMAMSAALPGAGQVYSGRTWDGLYSLIQTALPASFSYLNYRRDGPSSMRGAAHAFLAVGFYVGGIFGAEQAAAGRRIGPIPGTYVVNRRVLRERRSDPESLYEEAMASAAVGRWKETEEALAVFSENCSDPADRTAVSGAMRFLVHRRTEREASARNARILSAALPGAGQLRAGKHRAAATAFVVNAALGYYAYRTTETRSWGEFALFALPMYWKYYRGNVVTAGKLAASRDDRRDFEELRRLVRSVHESENP